MKPFYFIIIFSLSIYACFPGPVTYYKPSSSIGELISSYCGTPVAPNDTIEFKCDGMQVQVTCSSRYLRLFVYLKESNNAKFSSQDILFLYENREKEKIYKISEIKQFDFDVKEYNVYRFDDSLIGSERQGVVSKIPVRYEISVHFNQDAPKHFFIQLPPIILNNKVFEIPEIEFKEEKGFGIFPINC